MDFARGTRESSSNRRSRRATEISESGGQAPERVFYARAVAAFDTAASTPVLPGVVELSINVFLVYEIE
jgi:uncharacterized protein YggE